ncbi:TetR/AcrR family transcriptional regulator [Clostridium akagii]|uniref:TetR/AcrR family transcriptional regulator n=1 Tax=Clostridium akagii TaxID=91623 RepID=UPI00047EDFE8|nr:TetR/AcrR family transcriptional regulator [Clostridium akagii]
MESKKTDGRIKYTKMVIKQAFLELLEKQPLSKVTVTDICKRAEINRGTFYTYYTDSYDLLMKIENELFMEIKGVLEKALIVGTDYDFLIEILEYTTKNSALCKILFSVNGDKDFIQRILNLAHDNSILEYQSSAPEATIESLELLFIFISNGIIGIIQNFLKNDMKQSPKEVAEFIGKLNNRCIQIF